MWWLFRILWKLPDAFLYWLFGFDCIRRPLARVALRRVLRMIRRRSIRGRYAKYICFVDSRLSWMSYGICSCFHQYVARKPRGFSRAEELRH